MIANLINTLISLVMVYAAVLDPHLVAPGTLTLFFLGVVILGLSMWARMTDSASWFSQTNIVVGVGVLALAGLQQMNLTGPLVAFWGVFWCGLIVSAAAFWAALYRPVYAQ